MSFFKDAIKKGISQSISKAVEDATKNVVAPVVNKVAEATSEKINNVAKEMNQNLDEANANLTQAKESGVDLGELFGNYVNAAQSFAGNVAANFKECPKCGEVVPAQAEFCPNCGTKLEAGCIADDYTCSVCGEVNLMGQSYCAKCGGKLKGALKSEAKIQNDWQANLSQYPMYCCGGNNYSLQKVSETAGYPVWELTVENCDEEAGERYLNLCKEAGFYVPKGKEGYRMVMKVVDGINYAVSTYDGYQDGIYSIKFYVEDELPEEKESVKPTLSSLINDNKETIDKAAETAKDVANEAKKLISGFFKK